MRRSFLELLLTCVLAVNTLTVSVLFLFGRVTLQGPLFVAPLLFLLLGILAIGSPWLILKGKVLGLWCCLAHFALQLLLVKLPDGSIIGFTYGIAFNLTFGKPSAHRVTLNVTALLFSVCCIIALVRRHNQSRLKEVAT